MAPWIPVTCEFCGAPADFPEVCLTLPPLKLQEDPPSETVPIERHYGCNIGWHRHLIKMKYKYRGNQQPWLDNRPVLSLKLLLPADNKEFLTQREMVRFHAEDSWLRWMYDC